MKSGIRTFCVDLGLTFDEDTKYYFSDSNTPFCFVTLPLLLNHFSIDSNYFNETMEFNAESFRKKFTSNYFVDENYEYRIFDLVNKFEDDNTTFTR